ncbi:5-oxoprolinase subunit B family protein [Gordonia paraffinivorans]|uniref:5-oxoprolinase subunit B family protein n=1 Tax=Gordonia paraffinivorans TaxID=175628 RepID=UPI0015E81892|nr:carboxyltransferase domain-containing protein [Gordonia paraffinivorans]
MTQALATVEPQFFILPGKARLSFGGDEFVVVQLREVVDPAVGFDVKAALQVQAIVAAVTSLGMDGIVDIAPAHTGYTIRVRPEELDPRDLIPILIAAHQKAIAGKGEFAPTFATTVVEIPVFYNDPVTAEVAARFRDRHPSPAESDLEFVARVNGFDTVGELVDAHSAHPFIVTFTGGVPGNAESLQLVPREMQLRVPRYLSPRTETPAGAVGHGGNTTTIAPADAPSDAQLLGRAAVPVVDFDNGKGADGSPFLLSAPTVVKFTPVDESGYDEIVAAYEAGTYEINRAEVEFDLQQFAADRLAYSRSLVEELP